MFTKEQITKELQRIQSTIPINYINNVTKEKLIAPAVKMVIEKAVKDKGIPKEKREQYQVLLDSGDLDKKEIVENKSVVKKMNAWVDKEIKKSIKAGKLPSKKEFKKLYEN